MTSELWDKIQADQERQDSKTRERYPRHRATVTPLHGTQLTADPWTPKTLPGLLGWTVWCACSPSTVRHFEPDREHAARAWRCPRWRRT